MNSKLSGNSKTQNCEEIWDDKFSCFSADEDENAKALTLNTTNQFTNSLINNKGNIKKEDIHTFRNDDFGNDFKHNSEKVIDKLRLEFQIYDDNENENSYIVSNAKSHNDKTMKKRYRKTVKFSKEEKKEMWDRLKNQSSKEILKKIMPGFKCDTSLFQFH